MGERGRHVRRCAVVCLVWSFSAVLHAQVGRSTPAITAVQRGMTALHHFEYDDAYDAFREAQRADPGSVMAYWGEAMTCHQTLWRRENVEAAREALARLGPTRAARAARVASPKERGFLDAVEALFGDGDAATRHARYVTEMSRLVERYPDDPDAASFYALALLGTASRSLIGYSEVHDGHDSRLAGSGLQQQIASILQTVLASHPKHPGALHYLLHDYDDPAHARLGLDAARTYATIAGGSSHALHMPSHIFLQLGLWHDAAASDRAAFDVSADRARRKQLPAASRNFHALAWLQYELLQLGRYREAWQTVEEIEPVARASMALTTEGNSRQPLVSDWSSMRARYVIESRHWDLMSRERTFGNVDDLLAIGFSAARTHNIELAETARQALAARAQSEQEGDLRPAIAIMEREVAALLALAGGRRDEAVAILQKAAAAELALPEPLGLPSPAKPAPELLGEVLLEVGRPGDARASFDQALRRNANRSASMLGLARAAAALGQSENAAQRYREILANFDGADGDLPELAEVRAAVERKVPTERRSTSNIALLTTAGVLVSLALLFYARLSRRRIQIESQERQRVQRTRRK